MPGHETVPPDPDEAELHEGERRPGVGVPGEDAESGPQGRQGERDTGGGATEEAGARTDEDAHAQADAAAESTEAGFEPPARRLHDVKNDRAEEKE